MTALALAATLVGVFLTRDGILVAADTAAIRSTGFAVVQKYRMCGGNVAVLFGQDQWDLPSIPGQAPVTYDPLDAIKAACAQMASSRANIERQALELSTMLERFANLTFPGSLRDALPDGVLYGVVLAGYSNGRPTVLVTTVRRAREGFLATPIERMNERCLLVVGETRGANALQTESERLPADLSGAPAAAVFRNPDPPCTRFSARQAEEFFRLAMRVSVDRADAFGYEKGRINWPIDFVLLGPSRTEAIRREQRPQR